MNLSQMRTLVRRDLHDEAAASHRWTDAELDRHIDHAVRELSLSIPLETKATLTSTPGSRDLSTSSLTGLIVIEAVEYPVGKYPPVYVRFSLWANTLILLVDNTPASAEQVNVYHGKLHTLDATTSTIPAHLEELVTAGAAGYAALEWASFATNRVNVGGDQTWRQYLTWGEQRLAAFHKGLAKYSRINAIRTRRLYKPVELKPSQTTDWGP
ncbi:MAG: hypothetical protein HY676_02070 [Chloroflexi bacterium]|nr:hypothetical protein [Chloroflexota bacterium]